MRLRLLCDCSYGLFRIFAIFLASGGLNVGVLQHSRCEDIFRRPQQAARCTCQTHAGGFGINQIETPWSCFGSLGVGALCVWGSWCFGEVLISSCIAAAGFGGTFMSMAFEDPCFVYVGASGAVFGFIGKPWRWQSPAGTFCSLKPLFKQLSEALGVTC
jgi:hypothetical protein